LQPKRSASGQYCQTANSIYPVFTTLRKPALIRPQLAC
jgi:hypothetical protein